MDAQWSIAGGWAIDLVGGRQTRSHVVDLRKAFSPLEEDHRVAYLRHADLTDADMSTANMRGAKRDGTRSVRSNRSGADLTEGRLTDADFTEAICAVEQLQRAKSMVGIK